MVSRRRVFRCGPSRDVYESATRSAGVHYAMTREIHVFDGVFNALWLHFNQCEPVELSTTIAGYHLVSRFPEALAVDREAAQA